MLRPTTPARTMIVTMYGSASKNWAGSLARRSPSSPSGGPIVMAWPSAVPEREQDRRAERADRRPAAHDHRRQADEAAARRSCRPGTSWSAPCSGRRRPGAASAPERSRSGSAAGSRRCPRSRRPWVLADRTRSQTPARPEQQDLQTITRTIARDGDRALVEEHVEEPADERQVRQGRRQVEGGERCRRRAATACDQRVEIAGHAEGRMLMIVPLMIWSTRTLIASQAWRQGHQPCPTARAATRPMSSGRVMPKIGSGVPGPNIRATADADDPADEGAREHDALDADVDDAGCARTARHRGRPGRSARPPRRSSATGSAGGPRRSPGTGRPARARGCRTGR